MLRCALAGILSVATLLLVPTAGLLADTVHNPYHSDSFAIEHSTFSTTSSHPTIFEPNSGGNHHANWRWNDFNDHDRRSGGSGSNDTAANPISAPEPSVLMLLFTGLVALLFLASLKKANA